MKNKSVKEYIITVSAVFVFVSFLYSGNNPDKLQGPSQFGAFFINELPPQYLEDYYKLYSEGLNYNEANIWRNIRYLLTALHSPFRHPSKALCLLKVPEEGDKYKKLLKMHLNLKIMQNYLSLGALYDKKHIYYFNMPFKEDLIKSLNKAKTFYNLAGDFWKKVLEYAGEADKIKAVVSADYLENELFLILNREKEVDWDYNYIINLHLSQLDKNLDKLNKD